MGMMTWHMGVGVGAGVGVVTAAGAAMAGRVMVVEEVRRLWGACMVAAMAAIIVAMAMATMLIEGVIGVVRGVGAGRGGLMGVGVRGRKRNMIEGIDNTDEVWLGGGGFSSLWHGRVMVPGISE